MTKTVSGAMATHVAGEYLTLATCVKIKRVDGTILGFTDHDNDLTVNVDGDGSILYEASTSAYDRTAIQSSAKLATDNLEIKAILDSAAITDDDLRNNLYDGAEFKMFLVNWNDISDGIIRLRRGKLGQTVIMNPGEARVELRGMLQAISSNIVEVVSETCRADLGDNRCLVELTFPPIWVATTAYKAEDTRDANIGDVVQPTTQPNDVRMVCIVAGTSAGTEPVWPAVGSTIVDGTVTWRVDDGFRKTGSVTSVTNKRKFTDSARTEGSTDSGAPFFRLIGHWRGGFIKFTSGLNNNLSREVKRYETGGIFTMFLEFPFVIATSDTYEVALGCDKTTGRCKFFKNILNFRGEPFVPGNDRIFDFPDSQV